MPRFVIDEDMPRSTGEILKDNGYDVRDIRDCGLQGAEDEKIYEFAQKEKSVILTGDMDFGNILRFPLGSHYGIVIVHFPNEISNKEINRQILRGLRDLSEQDFEGNLIILEPGKIRIRKGDL